MRYLTKENIKDIISLVKKYYGPIDKPEERQIKVDRVDVDQNEKHTYTQFELSWKTEKEFVGILYIVKEGNSTFTIVIHTLTSRNVIYYNKSMYTFAFEAKVEKEDETIAKMVLDIATVVFQ